jgi:hypothetical protein
MERSHLPKSRGEVFSPSETLLFLDPSALLGDGGFGWLAEVPYSARANFVISKTFSDQIFGNAEYTAIDEELWGPLPQGASRHALTELVAALTKFSEEDAGANLPPEVSEVVGRLRNMGSQVAVEEWLYLQTNSWLAARTQNAVQHFKRGGAKVIEVAGIVVDDLTLLALGQRPGTPVTLTKKMRAQAAITVIVAGGVAAAGVVVPWAAVPGVVIALFIAPYLKPGPPTSAAALST